MESAPPEENYYGHISPLVQPPPENYGPPPPPREQVQNVTYARPPQPADIQHQPYPFASSPPQPPTHQVVLVPTTTTQAAYNNPSDATTPKVLDANSKKKYGAIICGVLQISLGIAAFVLGVVQASGGIFLYGPLSIIISIFVILAGSFGIQYGRTGNKCPCIASLVLSILSSLKLLGGFLLHLIVVCANPDIDSFHYASYRYTLETDDFGRSTGTMRWINRLSGGNYYERRLTTDAVHALLFLVFLINFIASVLQASFACALVCCQPNNTNSYYTYMNRPAHEAPPPAQQTPMQVDNQGFSRY